ncbi:hypothetical protein Nepgr_028371 [Nepenthes gracilis]|uniref:Uncharacterized protein n=1 Tax=Nepenthes gracilis TaxID=150966 RepID=A0AAD3TC80_NEPGR|nr:hypothetical protein Nepgr_028371 [Nepenthes gracilis]
MVFGKRYGRWTKFVNGWEEEKLEMRGGEGRGERTGDTKGDAAKATGEDEELVHSAAEPSLHALVESLPKKNQFEVLQIVDDSSTLQNIDNVTLPQMDSMKNEISNKISSIVNRPVSGRLTINCEKRPALEDVAPDVLEVSDLINGIMDDSIALTKDHACREGKLGVQIAKQLEERQWVFECFVLDCIFGGDVLGLVICWFDVLMLGLIPIFRGVVCSSCYFATLMLNEAATYNLLKLPSGGP